MKLFGFEIIIRRTPRNPLDGLTESRVDEYLAIYRPIPEFSMKIERIKAVRRLVEGTSLKDAKEWVEAHWE